MTAKKLIEDFQKENPLFPKYILEEMMRYLPEHAKDEDVKKVIENIKREYENALINPNEAIGIIAAQSVGAEATQMTLNTFHFAGVASHAVTGLPRLIEILDAKKNIQSPMMKLYLNKEGMTDEKFKLIAEKIIETKFSDFATNVDVDMDEKKIKIDLNVKKLKRLKIPTESLISFLDKKIRKNTEIIDEKYVLISETEKATLKDLMSNKELALNSVVYGIKGILDVTLLKEGDEFVFLTSGISLKQIMNIPEIDKSKIYCNDVHEICSTYGIEAARNVIIRELNEVVKNQGLTINERHVSLIADVMAYTGEIKGMTRYGIVGNKQNVLTRASFETPLRHLASGALQNEENELNTITENVMTNQIVRVGTGIPRISVKEKLK